jgi:hypothetical protein
VNDIAENRWRPYRIGVRVRIALFCAVLVTLGLSGETAPAEPSAVSAGCEETARGYVCLYGPIEVRRGEPATAPGYGITSTDAPPEAGYITSLRATLVDEQGNSVPRHAVHLHHAAWVNPTAYDMTCTSPYVWPERFFASGKERTKIELPQGYGYYWSNAAPLPEYAFLGDGPWLINYHLDAMHGGKYEVFLKLKFDFVPESESPEMTPIKPVWLDVENCEDSEFDVPKDTSPGNYKRAWSYVMPEGGTFVAMAGHLHDGGIKLRLVNETTDEVVFTSLPTYREGSWDLRKMSSFSDANGPSVAAGDVLELVAVYDDSRKWPGVMGIMVGALAISQ